MLYQPTQTDAPFDTGLNNAVLQIAGRLVPEFAVSNVAPASFAELKQHLDDGKRLVVAREGSENTIFGVPEINYAFRAWHDWCHWQADFDFSLEGECATCSMQIGHLRGAFGVTDQTNRWARLLVAEVIGQRQYFEKYRTYVVDQRAFARAYLADRQFALGRQW